MFEHARRVVLGEIRLTALLEDAGETDEGILVIRIERQGLIEVGLREGGVGGFVERTEAGERKAPSWLKICGVVELRCGGCGVEVRQIGSEVDVSPGVGGVERDGLAKVVFGFRIFRMGAVFE